MYKKILVAIDDSDAASRGLDEALKLARADDAQLRILHVIEPTGMALYPEAAAFAEDLFAAVRESGKAVLARAQARASKRGVEAKAVLIDNQGYSIADLIVSYATKWRAEVIVLGTHGRRGFSHLLMGSDAESVVRSSPVPVLLVRLGAAAAKKATADRVPGKKARAPG